MECQIKSVCYIDTDEETSAILVFTMNKAGYNHLATKDDLKKLATKTEIKQVEKTLRKEILRVEERVEAVQDGLKEFKKEIEGKVSGIDAKLDKLQNTLDGFVGTVDTLRTGQEIGTYQLSELKNKVDNHEKRISHLEPTTNTA